MLVLLSPSKRLNEKKELPSMAATQPAFLNQAEELAAVLKGFSPEDFENLMGVSAKIGELNYERYQAFQTPFMPENARPALFTFQGDVYDKMDVDNYTQDELRFAQSYVRILSGLYGVLRPMDLMQPYRLEMGTKLKNAKGANLYAYWGDALRQHLEKEASGTPIVNLASTEYNKAAQLDKMSTNVLTIDFKQLKDGKLKTFGMLAKRARGMMTNYIIKHQITKLEDLKKFNEDGYFFEASGSTETSWMFVKDMT